MRSFVPIIPTVMTVITVVGPTIAGTYFHQIIIIDWREIEDIGRSIFVSLTDHQNHSLKSGEATSEIITFGVHESNSNSSYTEIVELICFF